MKERSHLTAQGETEFWALRSGTFNTLYQQLNMPNVKKIVRVSKFLADLTIYHRFLKTKAPQTPTQSRALRAQTRNSASSMLRQKTSSSSWLLSTDSLSTSTEENSSQSSIPCNLFLTASSSFGPFPDTSTTMRRNLRTFWRQFQQKSVNKSAIRSISAQYSRKSPMKQSKISIKVSNASKSGSTSSLRLKWTLRVKQPSHAGTSQESEIFSLSLST